MKEKTLVLLGEDLKKPIRISVPAAERLSVAAVLFGGEDADIEVALDKKEGELILIIIHLSENPVGRIRVAVRHSAPKTKSDIRARSILGGKAQTNLDGLINISRKADESGAKLFAEAILFGNEAGINFLPAMEVETKNVTASHGVAVETIDPEKFFYLGSRGLNDKEVRQTLAESFISDAFGLTDEETAAKISAKIKSIV